MNYKIPKRTIKENKQFLIDMIEVQLNFIYFKRKRQPELTMDSLVNRYCMIINFTDFQKNTIFDVVDNKDVQKWNDIIKQIDKIYETSSNRIEFVSTCITRIFDNITEERNNRDLLHFDWLYYNEQCRNNGSLHYEITEGAPSVVFHISNAFYPESFLNYTKEFKRDINRLISKAKEAGAKEITCTSWLNQYPHWLEQWPEEYTTVSVTKDGIECELGIWGQFITHDYKINKKTRDKFIELQDFPYHMTTNVLKIKKHTTL